MMRQSLSSLYQVLGVSKQAVHQRLERQVRRYSYEHQLLFLVHELREEHPTMGSRDMYYLLQPGVLGRDAFESFCKRHGFTMNRPVNYAKTTDSQGVTRFENLTVDLTVTRLNQLWVSDITYFEVEGKFYYLTFIMDAYSRRILGYNASARLFTEQTTLPALLMAEETRKGIDLEGTIIHSDGGGQYYDHAFLKESERLKLVNSMCEHPWENGKAERINGVIKNNYLRHRSIKNYADLLREIDRSVQLYNEKKPHRGLKRVSPVTFENRILNREGTL